MKTSWKHHLKKDIHSLLFSLSTSPYVTEAMHFGDEDDDDYRWEWNRVKTKVI